LVVVNKCDLPGAAELVRWARRVNRTPVRAVSALTSEGIAELAQLMLQRLLRAEV
jgi:50S ribosomal subunit-associated GTPase HflX